MLVISFSSDDLCLHQKIVENINGRAIFVIVVIECWTSFYRIYVPAYSDLECNDRKVNQSFMTNFYCPFSQHERF